MAEQSPPRVILVSGPNGAGKSTTATALVRDGLGIKDYVNVDTIARGLSAFASEEVAFEAGRIMLKWLDDLAAHRADFAFETTLAGRAFAPWIAKLRESGYEFHLFYLWLRSADEAIDRVRQRVRQGCHSIPEEVIRRRYEGGLRNFFRLYSPIADHWAFYDNSLPPGPRLVASGKLSESPKVLDPRVWSLVAR